MNHLRENPQASAELKPVGHHRTAPACIPTAREMSATPPEALALADLHAASQAAQRAHRAHERRALDLQLNDRTGAFA